MVKGLVDGVLDLIYPSNIYCICCDGPIDKRFPYSMCPGCARMVHWAEDMDCAGEKEKIYCVTYGLLEKSLIYGLKYHDKGYFAEHLGRLMHERLKGKDVDFDIIVPVPMYKRKERRRGYNQAALLAKVISESAGIPHSPNLLIRTEDTTPMSGLGREMRKENVKDVFMVAKWVQNKIYEKTILLVDDVYTTGSTAESCIEALKKSGAKEVLVLTFAASGYDDQNR